MSAALQRFGQQASRLILDSVAAVPPAKRDRALRELFDRLDPQLAGRVAAGVAAGAGLERAMTEAMTRGLVEQFVREGSGSRSAAGLGYCQLGVFDDIVGGVKSIGSTVGGWVGSAAKAVGKIGCKVASHPAGQVGAAGAASAYGGPAAGAAALTGSQMIAGACNPPPPPSPLPGILPAGSPAWAVPALFGGGALVLYLLLR